MKKKELIIIGAGNSTLEIIDIIEDINYQNIDKIKVIGILDDDIKLKNKHLNNIPILGQIKEISKFKNAYFFLGIFSYKNRFLRNKIIMNLKKFKKRFINIIHPNSLISKKANIGYGCLISNNVNIYHGCKLGSFTTISPSATLAPFVKIDNNCFVGDSVVISYKSRIKKNSYMGFHSGLSENVKIAEGSRVLPYTLVSKNFKKKAGVIFGLPARLISIDRQENEKKK